MKNLVVANWKMNPVTKEEARELAGRIELAVTAVSREKVEVVICPPHPFLATLQHLLHFVRLGAQNMAAETKGPYTGEVAAGQILSLGGRYVILGHSERRALGEDDKLIARKFALAIVSGLHPILCVGAGTRAGQSMSAISKVVKGQLGAALRTAKAGKADFTVVYEPVWAISRGLGTGEAVSPAHAAGVVTGLRKLAPRSRFIYGGSVDAKNAAGFAGQRALQGALVGGASLDSAEFLQIVKAFSKG